MFFGHAGLSSTFGDNDVDLTSLLRLSSDPAALPCGGSPLQPSSAHSHAPASVADAGQGVQEGLLSASAALMRKARAEPPWNGALATTTAPWSPGGSRPLTSLYGKLRTSSAQQAAAAASGGNAGAWAAAAAPPVSAAAAADAPLSTLRALADAAAGGNSNSSSSSLHLASAAAARRAAALSAVASVHRGSSNPGRLQPQGPSSTGSSAASSSSRIPDAFLSADLHTRNAASTGVAWPADSGSGGLAAAAAAHAAGASGQALHMPSADLLCSLLPGPAVGLAGLGSGASAAATAVGAGSPAAVAPLPHCFTSCSSISSLLSRQASQQAGAAAQPAAAAAAAAWPPVQTHALWQGADEVLQPSQKPLLMQQLYALQAAQAGLLQASVAYAASSGGICGTVNTLPSRDATLGGSAAAATAGAATGFCQADQQALLLQQLQLAASGGGSGLSPAASMQLIHQDGTLAACMAADAGGLAPPHLHGNGAYLLQALPHAGGAASSAGGGGAGDPLALQQLLLAPAAASLGGTDAGSLHWSPHALLAAAPPAACAAWSCSVGEPASRDAAMHNPLYKTELCRSWQQHGGCRYGARCQFAHGAAELRPLVRHPKYRTQPCRTFALAGRCPYGERCTFIHGAGPAPLVLNGRASSGGGDAAGSCGGSEGAADAAVLVFAAPAAGSARTGPSKEA